MMFNSINMDKTQNAKEWVLFDIFFVFWLPYLLSKRKITLEDGTLVDTIRKEVEWTKVVIGVREGSTGEEAWWLVRYEEVVDDSEHMMRLGGEGDPHLFYLQPTNDITQWCLQYALTP